MSAKQEQDIYYTYINDNDSETGGNVCKAEMFTKRVQTRELRVPDHAMAFFGLVQVESIFMTCT